MSHKHFSLNVLKFREKNVRGGAIQIICDTLGWGLCHQIPHGGREGVNQGVTSQFLGIKKVKFHHNGEPTLLVHCLY